MASHVRGVASFSLLVPALLGALAGAGLLGGCGDVQAGPPALCETRAIQSRDLTLRLTRVYCVVCETAAGGVSVDCDWD